VKYRAILETNSLFIIQLTRSRQLEHRRWAGYLKRKQKQSLYQVESCCSAVL